LAWVAVPSLVLGAAGDVGALCGDEIVDDLEGESCDDGNHHLTDACPDGPGGTCQASSRPFSSPVRTRS
jgi:hypothetical protein